MFYRSKYISLNVIPSEWYDAKCDTVLSICGVKCGERGWSFWKNGGNFRREEWKSGFCQKRVTTLRASGQTGLRADGPPGRWASGQTGLRADGRRRTSGIRRSRKQKEGRKKQIERTSGRAWRPEDGRRKQGGSARQKVAKLRIATFIFHWKLFPSNAIARLK